MLAKTQIADMLPPVFDPAVVRAAHEHLRGLDDHALEHFYQQEGKQSGMLVSAGALRESLIPLIHGSVLELGPFCMPVFEGERVKYLDFFTAKELFARGTAIGLDTSRSPTTIHYNALTEIGEQFDVVFSSHNIEHYPDLVKHLVEAARVLRAGGAYVMMIPDKRYCFDHFIKESTVADVLQAYYDRRETHSLKSVIECRAMTAHNDALAHWNGVSGDTPNNPEMVRSAMAEYEAAVATGEYIDVHAWQFTPDSFERIIQTTFDLGLQPFQPTRVYQTPYGRLEFAAVLTLAA